MDTREKIIAAAMNIFAEKGKHGARMEEIAERAGVNKAMVYYFYTTRENLYREVLSEIFIKISEQIVARIRGGFERTDDFQERVKIIVAGHFEAYSGNPDFNKIILEAISISPDDVRKALETIKMNSLLPEPKGHEKLISFFEEGIARGVFRKVNARQIMISIVGMNLVYFIAKPISQFMLESAVKDEKKFLKERQDSIIDLLLNGIMNNRSRLS